MTTQTPSTKNRDIPEEEIQALLDKDLGPQGERVTAAIKSYVGKFKAAVTTALIAVVAVIGLLITAVVMGFANGFAAAVPFVFFAVAAVAVIIAMVKVIRLKGAQIVYLYEMLEEINTEQDPKS